MYKDKNMKLNMMIFLNTNKIWTGIYLQIMKLFNYFKFRTHIYLSYLYFNNPNATRLS